MQRARLTAAILTAMVSCLLPISSPAAAPSKTVYLTFDDGPSPVYTPQVLQVLRMQHVPATFFVLGYRCKQYPWILRRMLSDGHEIGNHGYYHTFIVNKPKQWILNDVRMADSAIESACGVQPMYFRPPGGFLPTGNYGLVYEMGHSIATWTVDTNDWRAKSPSQITEIALRDVRPGAIILMHDGIASSRLTVAALPTLIEQLRARGYTFAVLPEGDRGQFIGHTIAKPKVAEHKVKKQGGT